MKPITTWKRFNEDTQKWSHNHIEDGHIEGDQYLKPVGSESQTANWSKGTWIHEHKHLHDNKVV